MIGYADRPMVVLIQKLYHTLINKICKNTARRKVRRDIEVSKHKHPMLQNRYKENCNLPLDKFLICAIIYKYGGRGQRTIYKYIRYIDIRYIIYIL